MPARALMSDCARRRLQVRSLRVMRVMRVLRLIKLIRLLRASRLFKRWETKLAINYSQLHLTRSIMGVCYISHFFACIWGLSTHQPPTAHHPARRLSPVASPVHPPCRVHDAFAPAPLPGTACALPDTRTSCARRSGCAERGQGQYLGPPV